MFLFVGASETQKTMLEHCFFSWLRNAVKTLLFPVTANKTFHSLPAAPASGPFTCLGLGGFLISWGLGWGWFGLGGVGLRWGGLGAE